MHRDTEQFALDGITEQSDIGGWIECPANSGERGLQLLEGFGESVKVVRVGVGNQSQILGASDIAVRADCYSTDYDEPNFAPMQDLQQRPEVEFGQ